MVTFWQCGMYMPEALKCYFSCNMHVLARKLASPFGHPAQVSRQVQLAATCNYILASLFRQGLTLNKFHRDSSTSFS